MRRKNGFTLVEILIVVVIAASVLMFAVPATKKAQERNKYLAATGVLADIGMAMQALRIDAAMQGSTVVYPAANHLLAMTATFQTTSTTNYQTSQVSDLASLNDTIFPYAIFSHGYMQSIPYDGTNTYKGYSFTLCPQETSTGEANNVVVIMQTSNSATYQGARFLQDGTIQQISNTNPTCS